VHVGDERGVYLVVRCRNIPGQRDIRSYDSVGEDDIVTCDPCNTKDLILDQPFAFILIEQYLCHACRILKIYHHPSAAGLVHVTDKADDRYVLALALGIEPSDRDGIRELDTIP